MFKVYLKDQDQGSKAFNKAAKRFNLKAETIQLVSSDSFLGATIYLLAISAGNLYVFSTGSKQPEMFKLSDFEQIIIENKTDLNLIFKGGRIINLTSVVGVKTSVSKLVEKLNESIKSLR